MEPALIISVLQEWNPWEKSLSAGIPRAHYLTRIYPFIDNKEVLILQGIRRSGKSTILKQLIRELISNTINPMQILYLNLEDYHFSPYLTIELLEEVFQAYKEHTHHHQKTYMFIDEIQKIENWEKWVRTYYDKGDNIKFIISGSSSKLMSRELSTLMTGRNITFTIWPLSFQEFCSFNSTQSLPEYLEFGGFPEVVLQPSEFKKKALLQQYFTDILHKDVISRHDIRNAKQMTEIASYLINAAGGKISVSKLSKVFGLSHQTISLYISYLVEAYLLYEVSWFSYSLKTRHDVTKLPKLYALDNGFINALSTKYKGNKGQAFENAVLIHLAAAYKEVHYWSTLKTEVDFIVERKAFNVTATDDIPEREWQGLQEFQKKHKNFKTLLITESSTGKNCMSLKDFLLQSVKSDGKFSFVRS